MFSGINREILNVAMLAGARLQKGRQKQHFFLKKAKCLWMKCLWMKEERKGREETRAQEGWGEKSKQGGDGRGVPSKGKWQRLPFATTLAKLFVSAPLNSPKMSQSCTVPMSALSLCASCKMQRRYKTYIMQQNRDQKYGRYGKPQPGCRGDLLNLSSQEFSANILVWVYDTDQLLHWKSS